MRDTKDFDSLEDWADRKLKQLGPSTAPKGFLGGVMHKIHASPVVYSAPEQPSLVIIWIRIMVVIASLMVLIGGLVWDPNWVQTWWAETSTGMTLRLIAQLLIGLKQSATALIGLVPSSIWVGLGVSLTFAYLMAAIVGSALLHFTFRRIRIQ